MAEEPASPSQRAEARALAKKRQTKDFERRESIFDLFVSGFSHQQIATALKTSTSAVRRVIDTAVADRRGSMRPRRVGRSRPPGQDLRAGERRKKRNFSTEVARNPLRRLISRKQMEGKGSFWKAFFGLDRLPEAFQRRPFADFEIAAPGPPRACGPEEGRDPVGRRQARTGNGATKY